MSKLFIIATLLLLAIMDSPAQYLQWEYLDLPAGTIRWQPHGPRNRNVATGILRLPDGVILASTIDRQVFRSNDAGLSWTRSDTGFGPRTYEYVVPFRLYRGPSGDIYCGGDGLFRSTDQGVTWERLSLGNSSLWGKWVISMMELPTGELLVGAYPDYVRRSTDRGQTWERITSNIPRESSPVHGLSRDSSGVLFLGADYGAFRSTDKGKTWTSILDGLKPWKWFWYHSVAPDGSILTGGYQEPGVFRSTDHGVTWTLVSVHTEDGQGMHIMAVDRAGTVYGTKGDPESGQGSSYRSTDDGVTFSKFSEYVIRGIQFLPGDTILAALDGDGIRQSFDGGSTWKLVRTRAMEVPVTALGFDDEGRLYSGSTDGVRASEDSTRRWLPVGRGIPAGRVHAIATAPGGVLAGADSGLFRTMDTARTWNKISFGDTSAVTALFSSGGVVLAGTRDGHVYRSGDVDTWTRLDVQTSNAVGALLRTPGNVYVAASGNGLYVSPDGSTWSRVDGDTMGVINALSFDSLRVVYAGTSKGLYLTLDNGASWVRANPESDIVVTHLSAGRWAGVLAATTKGFYYHRTYKPLWRRIEESPRDWAPTAMVTGMVHHLWAGSADGGVHHAHARGFEPADVSTEAGGFEQLPTFEPNPLRGVGSLVLRCTSSGLYSVVATDVLGRVIEVLHDKWLAVGEHRIEFDGRKLPSGSLFLRVSGPDCYATVPVLNHH
jgi:photosystem II stability/assembly factor-like uncharacterized protein